MHEYRVPLDPRNPGQFLACCGMFELADISAPGGIAAFERACQLFALNTDATFPPKELKLLPAAEFENKTLEPLTLACAGGELALNWWLNETLTGKSAFKTWGGQQTPRRVLEELLGELKGTIAVEEMFAWTRYMKSCFGVDARAAWEALDAGYSPNDIGQDAATFPWVEILAVIGLQGFRPAQQKRARYCGAIRCPSLPPGRPAQHHGRDYPHRPLNLKSRFVGRVTRHFYLRKESSMPDVLSNYDALINEGGPSALVLKEYLQPAAGPDEVIFPPTFAPPEEKRKDPSSYIIDGEAENTVCLLDSVGSQANRLEALFKQEKYRAFVPQISVNVEGRIVNLLDLGHRAADALIQSTKLTADLQKAFLECDAGNAVSLAKVAPTSLVFGAWDSLTSTYPRQSTKLRDWTTSHPRSGPRCALEGHLASGKRTLGRTSAIRRSLRLAHRQTALPGILSVM